MELKEWFDKKEEATSLLEKQSCHKNSMANGFLMQVEGFSQIGTKVWLTRTIVPFSDILGAEGIWRKQLFH